MGGSISYEASTSTKITATLNCFYGYLPLNGNNKRDCRAESISWTGQPFTCIRKYLSCYIVSMQAIIIYTFPQLAQVCGPYPSVQGSTTQVIITDPSNNGSYTVNTTITYTCPDNTTQSTTCSYAPGRITWNPATLQDCITVVGKNI